MRGSPQIKYARQQCGVQNFYIFIHLPRAEASALTEFSFRINAYMDGAIWEWPNLLLYVKSSSHKVKGLLNHTIAQGRGERVKVARRPDDIQTMHRNKT